MEASGLIRQYVALLDAGQLGLHLNVFVSISLRQQSRKALQAFEERITLLRDFMKGFDQMFDAFLKHRTSESWQSNVEQIRRWMGGKPRSQPAVAAVA